MSRSTTILPYTRPEGASDKDAARARTLLRLRPSPYRKEERERQMADDGKLTETLQDLAAKYDKGQQRFTPPARKKNLRNVEFLPSLIVDGEGRSAAGPPIWRIPVELPIGRKRGRACSALPAPAIDGCVQPEVTATATASGPNFDPSTQSVYRYIANTWFAGCCNCHVAAVT